MRIFFVVFFYFSSSSYGSIPLGSYNQFTESHNFWNIVIKKNLKANLVSGSYFFDKNGKQVIDSITKKRTIQFAKDRSNFLLYANGMKKGVAYKYHAICPLRRSFHPMSCHSCIIESKTKIRYYLKPWPYDKKFKKRNDKKYDTCLNENGKLTIKNI